MRTLLLILSLSHPVVAQPKITLVAEGLKEPFGVDFHGGMVYCTEFGAHRVIAIDAAGKVTVVAGSGKKGAADGVGEAASFNGPHNLAIAMDGTIYVADTVNHTIRRIDAKTRAVTTIAGTGQKGFAGDGGPATAAKFDQTYHVTLDDREAKLTVTDLGNHRIRQIDLATGIVTTIAGSGVKGVLKDGIAAREAPLNDPRAHVFDAKKNLWILERGGHRLRVVESGKVRNVAGTGQKGFSGDDGPAVFAKMDGPKFLCIDAKGDVLIADTENHCLRKLDVATGTIRRLVGSGTKGKGNLDSDLLKLDLNRPHGVAIGHDGALIISDTYNGRILKVQ
jgi:sugar lactone lactonase YvrE